MFDLFVQSDSFADPETPWFHENSGSAREPEQQQQLSFEGGLAFEKEQVQHVKQCVRCPQGPPDDKCLLQDPRCIPQRFLGVKK